jgi:very-short-patch-repair endonuclease
MREFSNFRSALEPEPEFDQVARDRRRDAEINKAGIKIIRFTGSEIYRHSEWCAGQVLRALA